MPPPRGNYGDIPNKDRTAGLSKAKRKGDAVEFSEDTFAKWVTGAHKRRVERQKIGHKQAADMIKAEKAADKRQQNEKVREIVKQQFGDITVDRDGRVVFSGNGQNDDFIDSEEEYDAKQRELTQKREKKTLLQEKERAMKSLPKWAQKKLEKELEMVKDDSIVKEQNESFIGAQYSFNKENGFDAITQKAQKNKLLNNLERKNREQKDKEHQGHLLPQVMNFENDDSVVVVETSNMDQANLSSAIISRRAQRELAQNSQISANQIGRRAAALLASSQVHTMVSDESDSSDDEEVPTKKEPVLLSKRKQDMMKKDAQRNAKATQKVIKAQADGELSELQQLQAKFNNKGKGKKSSKGPQRRPIAKMVILEESGSDYEEDQRDYFTTSSEEEKCSADFETTSDGEDDDAMQNKITQFNNKVTCFNPELAGDDVDVILPPPPQRRQREPTANNNDDVDDEWSVIDEVILLDRSGHDDDEDLMEAKFIKVRKKRDEKQQRELEAQQHLYELEQQHRLEKKEKDTKAIKRQKLNDPTRGGISSEYSRDHDLAASISAQLLNSEFTLEAATPVPMANASAWFMLPKPQAWTDQDERKKRLQEQKNRTEQISEGTWDFEAEKQRKRKLTPLEAMEYDPTYGWEEGEGSNNKDLTDIFGIPAASMGGRYRKKPLSDKNKKKSSDARKAKKQEKQREKDQQMAMAFEAGFADSNTSGRSIKWDESSDDDSGKSYRGGAKFQDPKNRKERKKFESKQKAREQSLHKRGRMVAGKYYFGEKDSAVTF